AASVDSAIQRPHAQLGQVSILVNNAASWVAKEFKDTTPAEVDRVLGITLTGTINVTRAALPDVIERRGRIINIISDSARTGERFMSVYAAPKAGLIGRTKTVAQDAGAKGVMVNGVPPGTPSTPGGSGAIKRAGGPQRHART